MILAVSITVGLAVLVLLYRVIFHDWDELCECFRYALQPDFVSWIQGEFGEDLSAELKLGFWTMLSFAAGTGTYFGLSALFG